MTRSKFARVTEMGFCLDGRTDHHLVATTADEAELLTAFANAIHDGDTQRVAKLQALAMRMAKDSVR